jgi:hypothetical protein
MSDCAEFKIKTSRFGIIMPKQLWIVLVLLMLAGSLRGRAQRNQGEILTQAQQDKIAEAGIFPDERIALYTKFVNEHAETIKNLSKRTEAARGHRLDQELEDFASLVDELSSNLDEYGGRMADIRKSLKGLNEDVPRWQELVKGLPNDSAIQISRDDATGALSDLAADVKQLTVKQEAYFKEHKDAKGQQREEPK